VGNSYNHKQKVENNERKEERTQKNLFTQFGPNWPSMGERAALRSTIMMSNFTKEISMGYKNKSPAYTTRNLAYCQGRMPGARIPGKFARSYARENSWQICQGQPHTKVVTKCIKLFEIQMKKRRFLVGQKSRAVQQFARGFATKSPWQITKPENLSAKPAKAT